jgi:cyclophilin family peptidyl-prolyl cis-trans isomerase
MFSLFAFAASVEPKVTQRVFFDIEANNVSLGRIVFGLYGEFAPKAVENFYHLSACDLGKGRSDVDRCYKWVRIHHIIQDVQMQAGDYILGTGGVSESIWGGKFEDENLTALNHTGPGILTMANGGKNANGSQFIITLTKTEWLDGKHQIFGRVMSGMNVLKEINKYGSKKGRPVAKVVIANCGPI